MKKIFFLGLLVLLLAQMVQAQEQIEVPIWNVGDRWVFTQGIKVGVIGADENNYVVEYPNQTVLYAKSTLNRVYSLQGGEKRESSKESLRRLFDFPLTIGKNWKDTYLAQLKWEDIYTAKPGSFSLGDETQMFESYKVIRWEDVKIRAGSFKAIKVEYKRKRRTSASGMREGRMWYWYSPEVKNLIKVQYDKSQMWSKETNWKLISFQLVK